MLVLTGALAAAVSEVALSDDEDAARALAEDVLTIIGRIQGP